MPFENGVKILGYFRKCEHKRLLKRSFIRKNCRSRCNKSDPDWCYQKQRLECSSYDEHSDSYPCRYWIRTHPNNWKNVQDIQDYTNKKVRQLPIEVSVSGSYKSGYRKL